MRVLACLLAVLASSPALLARIDLLLVPPADPVARDAGLRLTLYLNNPTAFPDEILLPRVIEAVCSGDGQRQGVQVEAVGAEMGVVKVPAGTRKTVELRVKNALAGPGPFVSLRLLAPESNAIMFELRPSPPAGPAPKPAPSAPADLDLSNDFEAVSRHISAYDPIYLAAGWRTRFNARFQFSFKYRFLEDRPDEDLLDREPVLRHLARDLHFGYTQVSIWDLGSPSKPFYDTSYKPTLFQLHRLRRPAPGAHATTVQYGVQHESNGKSGTTGRDASRSLNSLYFAPTFRRAIGPEHFVEVRPRAIAYFNLDDNRDLARYRGYVELTLRAGHERGWQLATHLRGHPGGHGSAEFNLSLPVAALPWPRPLEHTVADPRAALGGYVQVQYFNGYGESLLDYNVRRRDQLRFGFMLVR